MVQERGDPFDPLPESKPRRHQLTFVQVSVCIRLMLDAALHALADPNRRRILAVVRDRPYAVGEIAEHVAMSQQAVSHHLHVLRGAGLVTEHHERTRHLFAIHTDGLRVVREFLDGFWPSHLTALKDAAEREARRMASQPGVAAENLRDLESGGRAPGPNQTAEVRPTSPFSRQVTVGRTSRTEHG
jgi:DNA-binding transcriptional ArsR family regulator